MISPEFKLVDNLGETRSYRVLTYDDRYQVFVCREIGTGQLHEYSMMYLVDRAKQANHDLAAAGAAEGLAHADTLEMGQLND